jgi:hypothetical protein
MEERHREVEEDLALLSAKFYDYSSKTGLTAISTATHQPYHLTSMDDVVIANFYSRMSKGEIFNNPMTKIDFWNAMTPQNCSYRYTATDGSYHDFYGDVFHSVPSYLPLPTFSAGDVQALALSKAWANVSSSEASALVSVAEAKKSVVGIVEVLRRFKKYIKLVKTLQWKKLRREIYPDEIADRWLEIRYGIRPLVYDAKSIVEALNTDVRERGVRQTFRGYAFEVESNSDTLDVPFGSYQTYRWDRNSIRRVEVRAGVMAQCETLKLLQKAEVWGLLDLPQAVLDLTTFSIVAGWFFNIADVIGSWTPSASWRPQASWTVTKTIATEFVADTGLCTWKSSKISNERKSGGTSLRKSITIERVPDPSRPILPRFNVRMDVSKLTDLAALSKMFWRSIPGVRY